MRRKPQKEFNMNKKNVFTGMAALLLSFGLVLAGCSQPLTEVTEVFL
jgi:hypothetical protein